MAVTLTRFLGEGVGETLGNCAFLLEFDARVRARWLYSEWDTDGIVSRLNFRLVDV